MTRPRAPQPAPSPGNRNIKEGCSSHTVGRGVGAKNEEGRGGTRPLGKRQGPQIGHQETGTSLERARPGWRKELRTELKAGKEPKTPSKKREGPVRRSERGLERETTKEIAMFCPGRVPRDKVALEWKLVTIQLPVPEEGLNCLT